MDTFDFSGYKNNLHFKVHYFLNNNSKTEPPKNRRIYPVPIAPNYTHFIYKHVIVQVLSHACTRYITYPSSTNPPSNRLSSTCPKSPVLTATRKFTRGNTLAAVDGRQNGNSEAETVSRLLAPALAAVVAIDGNPFIGQPLLMVHAYTD